MPNFPEINYASVIRNFESGTSNGKNPIISIPRPKYTWFMEMEISYEAMVGNYYEGLSTGKILAALKSMDRPQISFDVEKLKSYNNVRIVPKKMEYKPATMVFFDDTASYVAKLMKAYRAFYHYSGDVTDASEFGDGVGTNARPTGTLPSMGMKMRSGDRHFFKKITVYDLGTAPNSINVYHFVHPFISDLSWEGLDYYDGTGMSSVTLSMDYEGFFEEIGRNVTSYPSVFSQIDSSTFAQIDGIGNATDNNLINEATSSNFFADTLSKIGGNLIDGAPAILSDTFANGEFNAKALKRSLITYGSTGTPIQDVRAAVRTATQLGQRADQKDFVGVLGAAKQLGKSASNLADTVFNQNAGTVEGWSDSRASTKSAADIMRNSITDLLDF